MEGSLGAIFNEKGDTINEVNIGEYSYSRKSQWRAAQNMEKQRATDRTEEKTRTVNDLADNEQRFRNMDLQNMRNDFERRMLRIS